ncbi:sulfite exporter TauE/SafE family protein [Verminephrobacter eiseniae]|uniref:Probable membrane transporter protein n=2 Tax=Verminephrobacter eiseniae TaxID=364317 RepID=A1WJZ3_VEREI|nr:sulfite exporter TauE/SafE family protein [Verminephrobacter eiseniae]ABM57950.1 protein of unknown function DUF81 [Verminephrobacter eiseniae EF01-2]
MHEIFNMTWQQLILIFLVVTVAYVVFGMVGFGTALIATPVLAIFIPVSKIVPLLALMDMIAALNNILRDGRKADVDELKRLIPLMMVGSLIGSAILLKSRPDILLLGLGIFVVASSLYSLSGLSPKKKFQPRAAIPFGIIGGVFSALFGSGGFIYAIYLSGRIEKNENLRMTQTTLIGISTLTRVILFGLAGIYGDVHLLMLTLILAPAMLCGVLIGRHITIRLTREQFIRLINVVTLFSGLFLISHYING